MTAGQDTDSARRGTRFTRPAPPHTFMLDGQRLRELRVKHGLSQKELADQAAISLTTVARLERHRRTPCRGWTLGRLARALGEDPATMMLQPPGEYGD